MTLKDKTRKNITLISLIATLVITTGIGYAYADSFLEGSLSGGQITGPDANDVTGTNSMAYGTGINVSGDNSVGFGEFHFVTDDNAFTSGTGNSVVSANSGAIGGSNFVGATTAFSTGQGNHITGTHAFTTGFNNNATGFASIVTGENNQVHAGQGFASGNGNIIEAGNTDNSFVAGLGNTIQTGKGISAVFGSDNISSGSTSFVAGAKNEGIGDLSATFGHLATGQSFSSFVAGQCNELETINEIAWVLTDPLLVIGNGLQSPLNPDACENRNNALTILKNGDIGIGTANPTDFLTIENDDRPVLSVMDTTNSVKVIMGAGNVNGFIGTESNDHLRILTNDDEKIRILTNGNVGIGTQNPVSELQVANGYFQLPPTGGGPPPNGDCDNPNELGRMAVDSLTNSQDFYLCTALGWATFSP